MVEGDPVSNAFGERFPKVVLKPATYVQPNAEGQRELAVFLDRAPRTYL